MSTSVSLVSKPNQGGNPQSREGELLGKSYVRLSDATTGTSLLNIYKGPSKFLDSWTADFSTDATGLAVDVRVVALMLAGGSQDLAVCPRRKTAPHMLLRGCTMDLI